MNSVFINKEKWQQVNDKNQFEGDDQDKIKIYFAFANSLGRIIDLSNVENTVYWCIQMFEEYRIFSLFERRDDPLDVLWAPVPNQSFSQLSLFNEIWEDLKTTKGQMMFEEETEDVRNFVVKTNNILPFNENNQLK